MLVNCCCSYAHPSIIDLTNSETHAKRFKNAQFSYKNATHADLDGSAMRRDAKRYAPRPTKTPNCGAWSLVPSTWRVVRGYQYLVHGSCCFVHADRCMVLGYRNLLPG